MGARRPLCSTPLRTFPVFPPAAQLFPLHQRIMIGLARYSLLMWFEEANVIKQSEQEPGDPRARLTGGVYLLYFAAAIGASMLSAPTLKPLQDFVNGLAFALYAVL